ncbi:TetR/AcrR family transcriptional regulator [Geminicoccus roseus]|uniref:TetR/AcrR family transcriptional regulator n=1 Tax=Geminicoccus roseus TaxID=404900 RepID=UPI0004199C04|nr:TetR/AcrR family transcriptional regulator [Geminicoccus roseus]
MKVSREQMLENRRRILEAASRLFRDKGVAAVTVAEVMKAAGLTHGGFYGHFQSKDELVAWTVEHALAANLAGEVELAEFARSYLSPRHRDERAGGCATVALGPETIRQTPEARAAMTRGLRRQIERLARTAPGADEAARRQAAIGSWAAMVGALLLARISDDSDLAEEILGETKAWIER